MTIECSVCECIWSGSKDRFCDVLEQATIPLDHKWPLLILNLRGIRDNYLLSEVQKSRMHELLVSLLQSKEYSQASFESAQKKVFEIITANHTAKLDEIARETSQFAKDMMDMFGKHRRDVAGVAEEVDTGIANGVEPASLLAGLRDTLKGVVAQMEHDVSLLATMSHNDSLTGLANRRSFDEFMDKAIAEWEQDKSPVSLILFDIDHFKKFNDTYGHLVGDQVLRTLAAQVKKILKPLDNGAGNVLGARYGGEEFAIVLRGDVCARSVPIAEVVRKTVQKTSLLLRDNDGKVVQSGLRVTVSIGVCPLWEGWKGAYQTNLIDCADKALYTAKRQGRNCTVRYAPDAKQTYIPVAPD